MSMRRKIVIGVAVAAAVGALAWAGASRAHGGEFRHQARAIGWQALMLESAPGLRDPQRLADALKLTEAQKPAWDAYAAALAVPRTDITPRPARAATAPERLEEALAATRLREERAARRLEAMKALYTQLTPEQRQLFDTPRGFGRRWMH